MCTQGAGPDAAALYGDGLHGDGGVATSVPIHEFPHCAVPIGSTAGRGVACGRRSFYISPFLIRRQEGASPPLLLSDWLRGLGGGEAGPTRLLRLAERLVGVPWAEGQEELEARFLIGWGGGGGGKAGLRRLPIGRRGGRGQRSRDAPTPLFGGERRSRGCQARERHVTPPRSPFPRRGTRAPPTCSPPTAMAASRVGRVAPGSALLLLCDLQERFRPTVAHFPQVVAVAARVLQACRLLEVPALVTEQNPKALGPTVPELGAQDLPRYPKTTFSMVPPLEGELQRRPHLTSVLLCGIETQACILCTALDLLERGLDVHVVVDGCSSRSQVDRAVALSRLRQSGAFLTTSESVVLQLLRDSRHPRFRQVKPRPLPGRPRPPRCSAPPTEAHATRRS